MNKNKALILLKFILLPLLSILANNPILSQGQLNGNVPVLSETNGLVSLNGEWSFAVDYHDVGEKYEWYSPKYKDDIWDRVTTPHVWSLDPRYPYFIGQAWYRRQFSVSPETKDKDVRIVFEAVYHKAKVWLNGKIVGEHVGGYTPFEIDLSPYLDFQKPNLLVVMADNRIRTGVAGPQPQLGRAWMEDGGIMRDVYLLSSNKTYISKQKIEAIPDLNSGMASVRIITQIKNTDTKPIKVNLSYILMHEDRMQKNIDDKKQLLLSADKITTVEQIVKLPKELVYLWSLNSPTLYYLNTTLNGDENVHVESFGIRKFEARGQQLYLNGLAYKARRRE